MTAKNDGGDSRLERGRDRVRELHGEPGQRVLEALEHASPDLARYVYEFAFGDIYSRKGLSPKERQIATIASLVTLGYAQTPLKPHIHAALNVGCSREEVMEVIIQMAVYAGFPAAMNAALVAGQAFQERDAAGKP